ncbi:MAG: hypothetical protein AAGF96_18335, partial [Bacteroidota bacterium]
KPLGQWIKKIQIQGPFQAAVEILLRDAITQTEIREQLFLIFLFPLHTLQVLKNMLKISI